MLIAVGVSSAAGFSRILRPDAPSLSVRVHQDPSPRRSHHCPIMTCVDVLRAVVQGLAFVVEVAALAALAVWGWGTAGSTPVQVVLAVLAPVALAIVWGALLAPRARRRLQGPALVLAKLVALCGSGTLLATAGHPAAGLALVVVAAVDVLAAAALGVA